MKSLSNPGNSKRYSRFISALLTFAVALVLMQKPASATTYLYSFTFTAQDVLTALSVSQGALQPRLGVFSFFLEPTTLTGYTYSSETITAGTTALIDPWTSGTITDPSDLPNNHTYAYFDKVSQSNVQVITQTPSAFGGFSYTGTAPTPVLFGGVSETFNAAAVPLTTKFTIVLSSTSITNPVAFTGYASSATADSATAGGFGLGKTDKNLAFSLNLVGVAPEPGTWGLLLGGVGLILAGSWKRRGAQG